MTKKMDPRVKKFVNKYKISTYKGPLKEHHGKLIFFKAVSQEYGSLWCRCHKKSIGQSNVYNPGKTVISRYWDADVFEICGRGLHVGTLACAKQFVSPAFLDYNDCYRRIVKVLVDPEDIVCIPDLSRVYMTSSTKYTYEKIRCKKLYVEKEVNQKGR